MLQSMEVLAQALAQEMTGTIAHMVQLSTELHHIILLPLLESQYFLILQAQRSAPLTLLMIEVDRAMDQVQPEHFAALTLRRARVDDDNSLDAAELIEAVQEWLHSRSS
jgi:hypothetical protein